MPLVDDGALLTLVASSSASPGRHRVGPYGRNRGRTRQWVGLYDPIWRGGTRCPPRTDSRPTRVRPEPTRNRATSSIGFCVADSPIRTSGAWASAASFEGQREMARRAGPPITRGFRRRSQSAPCGAFAAALSREQQIERLRRRHEDVWRGPQRAARSDGVVSPVRTAR